MRSSRYSTLIFLLLAWSTVLLAATRITPIVAQPEQSTVAGDGSAILTADDLEVSGAVIGQVIFDKQDVFDTTLPGENKSLYRLANRWHIITRDSLIRQQLLFKPGDRYVKRLLEEPERLLQRNSYLFDAKITPVRYKNGVVDIKVWTRDHHVDIAFPLDGNPGIDSVQILIESKRSF
jgi:hypothetical protein